MKIPEYNRMQMQEALEFYTELAEMENNSGILRENCTIEYAGNWQLPKKNVTPEILKKQYDFLSQRLEQIESELPGLKEETGRISKETEFIWNSFLLDTAVVEESKPEIQPLSETNPSAPTALGLSKPNAVSEIPLQNLSQESDPPSSPPSNSGWPLSDELRRHTEDTSRQYGIDPAVLYAIMECESGFNQSLVSATNDYGICQINKSNHRWLREQYGLDVIGSTKDNITAAAIILSMNLEKGGGDLGRALTGYNTGKTGAPNAYAKKVMAAYQKEEYHVPVPR